MYDALYVHMYVHVCLDVCILKAAGMPAAFAPKQCSQQWVAHQHQKLMSSAQYLGDLSEFDVAGHRMEIRISPCNQPCSNWEEQLQELKDIFEAASKLLFAKALPFAEMLEAIKLALGEAEQSGLFRFQQERRNSRAPGHKLVDYNRLAHIFGPVNKFTHRHSLKLCQDEAPWGLDQPSDDVGLAGSWPVNPDLPKDVPRVFIRDGMSAKDVQLIGRVQGATVDWSLVAESLGQPQSASLLHEVACLTMWRRVPGRRPVGAPQQFGAVVRGKVHGPLGQDLVQAVCNLVGSGFHMEANRHAGAEVEAPSPAPARQIPHPKTVFLRRGHGLDVSCVWFVAAFFKVAEKRCELHLSCCTWKQVFALELLYLVTAVSCAHS